MEQPFSTSAAVLVGVGVINTLAVFGQDDVTKSDLTIQAADAERLRMQGDGYGMKEIQVKSDGKVPKFTIVFSRELPPGRFNFGATHKDLDREVFEARRHGGVAFAQLKGYRVGKHVFFALVTQEVAPRGAGVGLGVFWDVPAPALRGLVENEEHKGGKLLDTSTYEAPDGRTYHTAVFQSR